MGGYRINKTSYKITPMIDTLTSLRVIFALMVFASHLCILNEGVFSGHILKEGYVGVSFFFILSGFIIAYNSPLNWQKGAAAEKKSGLHELHESTPCICSRLWRPYS